MASDFGMNNAAMNGIVINFLHQDLISRRGTGQGPDPFKHSITKKGLRWFKKNINSFNGILYELERLGYYRRSFKKENIRIYDKLKDLYNKNVRAS